MRDGRVSLRSADWTYITAVLLLSISLLVLLSSLLLLVLLLLLLLLLLSLWLQLLQLLLYVHAEETIPDRCMCRCCAMQWSIGDPIGHLVGLVRLQNLPNGIRSRCPIQYASVSPWNGNGITAFAVCFIKHDSLWLLLLPMMMMMIGIVKKGI